MYGILFKRILAYRAKYRKVLLLFPLIYTGLAENILAQATFCRFIGYADTNAAV